MQSLEVISVNIWHIVISLCNLLILFLIVKKFLYKPVRKMLAERANAVDAQYTQAESALKSAEADRQTYAQKLQEAGAETESILRTAKQNADAREQEIVANAERQAADILRRAQSEIELERKRAVADMQHEIADLSAALTEKLLEREVDAQDHRGLIDSFIAQIGEDDDQDK